MNRWSGAWRQISEQLMEPGTNFFPLRVPFRAIARGLKGWGVRKRCNPWVGRGRGLQAVRNGRHGGKNHSHRKQRTAGAKGSFTTGHVHGIGGSQTRCSPPYFAPRVRFQRIRRFLVWRPASIKSGRPSPSRSAHFMSSMATASPEISWTLHGPDPVEGGV